MRRSKLATYRNRVKTSKCRGKSRCVAKSGCKRTHAGKRKSYCRKRSNKHV